jgi:sulfonate transport system permease protein
MTVITPRQMAPPGNEPPVIVRRPGSQEQHPRRSRRRRRVVELTLAIGIPVALVGLYQLATSQRWIDPRLYPTLGEMGRNTRDLWNNGQLWDAIYISCKRALIGFGFGALSGALVGFVMGASRLLRAALEPTLSMLYTVPKLALLPVFLTIFGFGERAIYVLIAVTVFFFVWISTMAAVMAVPVGYREAASTFGASRWQMFRHVLLPGALPQIFVGLRIAASVSILVLVGVEFVIGSSGLGYLINQGRNLLLLGQAYVCIVIVAAIGYLFMALVRLIGRLLTPWAPEDNAMVRQ